MCEFAYKTVFGHKPSMRLGLVPDPPLSRILRHRSAEYDENVVLDLVITLLTWITLFRKLSLSLQISGIAARST